MKKDKIGFVATLIIFFYVTSPFLYLVRTLVGDTGIAAIILRSSQPILMVLTFLACCFQNKFKLNVYSFTLLLIGFYGLSIAVIQENKAVDIMAGYLHFMTGIILFIYFSNSNKSGDMDKFMRVLSYFTLISYSIVLGLIHGLYFLAGIHIYLGLACQVLIIVFFYNFQKRRFILSFLSFFLIIISGKRGVFVALFLGVMITFLISLTRLHFKRALHILFAFVCIALLIVVTLPMTNEKLMNKYTYSEKVTVDGYSAGRWNEVTSAYNWWASAVENMVIGNGFGFTYTYVHSTKKTADTEDYKNVHFSYLNPVIILGMPIASIYFICLACLFIRVMRNKNLRINYMKLSSITYFIYACFVFNLFDEPVFWMINGLLYNQREFAKKTTELKQFQKVSW